MFKRILVPTDGSPLSAKAVAQAIELAKATGGEIISLHVYPRFSGSPYGGFGPSADVLEIAHERQAQIDAHVMFSDIRDQASAAGVSLQTRLVANDEVWPVIVAQANETGCDLICMASHGRRGTSALLLGSETSKVLTHCHVPVLVIR